MNKKSIKRTWRDVRRAKHAAEFLKRLERVEDDFRAFQERPSRALGAVVSKGMRDLGKRGRAVGFPELDANARLFVERFKVFSATAQEVTDPVLFELEGGLRIMEHVIALAADQYGGGSLLSRQGVMPGILQTQSPLHGQGAEMSSGTTARSKELFVLGDGECLEEIVRQLENIGYAIRRFESVGQVVNALDTPLPLGVLVAQSDLEKDLSGVQALEMSLSSGFKPVPIFSVCGERGIEHRLTAVRGGANGYFPDAGDITELVDALEAFSPSFDDNPFRILLVDDDKEQADYHAGVLNDHGMQARVVQNPLDLLQIMVEFGPDLVLMDLYMPGVSGAELGKVVRQDPVLASVPIVFFSAEKDLVRQLDVVSEAGDYFLSKDMLSDHMAESVRSRAARYRRFRSKMMRDSLTGLLNHTNIKLMLENEVRRASRGQGSFAFVMLDLDHFKNVNDTYGHPTGDLVLRAVARVLKQRLRQSDVIGRYGGEEFAALLVDVPDAEVARSIMDQVREHFALLEHRAEEGVFNVTVSCGVAMYPDFTTAEELAEAADKALYEAKQAGRNQVVLARPGKKRG